MHAPPLGHSARHSCHTHATPDGDVSTTRRANVPTVHHPSMPGHYIQPLANSWRTPALTMRMPHHSMSAALHHHLPTRSSHWYTSAHHARANDAHTAPFNVHPHLQHMASNSRHIQRPLAPANASRRIRSHLTPVTYNDNSMRRRPLRPMRTHAQHTARPCATSRIVQK
jgi:hypothetical protein